MHLNGRMGTLPQSDFTKADARLELANFSAAMKKPQLVGEPATAELASAVLSDYGAAFMRCLPKAGQIQLERAHAATQDALYNDAHLQVKRVLAEMTAYNESGGAYPEKFDRLQRSFDFFSKQAQSHADARQGHQNTGNALQMAYLQDLVATMKSLSAKFCRCRLRYGTSWVPAERKCSFSKCLSTKPRGWKRQRQDCPAK